MSYQHKKASFSFQEKINFFFVKCLQTPYLMLYLSSINRLKKQYLFIKKRNKKYEDISI